MEPQPSTREHIFRLAEEFMVDQNRRDHNPAAGVPEVAVPDNTEHCLSSSSTYSKLDFWKDVFTLYGWCLPLFYILQVATYINTERNID
ncbi:uncharacterized protein LOC118201052 isoform X2 [Stegodyphus dumicola]|uniref:uncharacterized protein LOC118201052 isoform X2 n=1 Tax=Stegodyphus dumicola TaxID=202533 RepID=UPI0015B25652|nr:uncharacterized protein LOC118201052 isoform X2 [Stegodyphus dumicola]